MEPRPFQLLQGVIRIANRPADEPVRTLQTLLRFFRRGLRLRECRLLLLDSREKYFHATLEASGPPRYIPTTLRFAGSNAGRCLSKSRTLERGPHRYLPVANSERNYGVLLLEHGGTWDATREDLATAVAAQIAVLLAAAGGREGPGPASDYARLQALSAENDRKYREISLLYRLSRALHSTLRLNDLMHLILSAATVPEGGGFERSMLFMVNERSGILQGMLGVTSETAALVLPTRKGVRDWEQPEVNPASREAQRRTAFCRQVMTLRLSLEAEDNPLVRAVRTRRVVMIEPGDGRFDTLLPVEPPPGAFACVPLAGRDRPLAVLVVDNPSGTGIVTPGRRRFLQLFGSQASAAMENSMLLHRLETAHQDLRETQERLIQGEKMAVLGEMAASVAHELKNPLVSIGGFARRLAGGGGDEDQRREYAAIVSREVQRMEKILEDILAFSRKNMLCFAPCDLAGVVAQALELELDALKSAGVEVQVEAGEGLPVVVGDEQKLRQVVANLLTNARQAMESTGGTLTVRTFSCLLRGEKAVGLEVEDSGGGMAPEVLRNIFNPFFTTKEQGTGLGLSISHRIVAHHGGEFEVENREHGAAFVIRLPGSSPGKAFR